MTVNSIVLYEIRWPDDSLFVKQQSYCFMTPFNRRAFTSFTRCRCREARDACLLSTARSDSEPELLNYTTSQLLSPTVLLRRGSTIDFQGRLVT